jgi:hypothetical protein
MLLMALLLVASLATPSASQSLGSSIILDSNTCIKRSVYVYTADSSTYVVTNLGSTSLSSSPTYCPNASISTSTVYGTNYTITAAALPSTVYITPSSASAQISSASPTSTSTASSAPTAGAVVADDGFENGNATPFNSSSSSADVTAQVVQEGPLRPYSGNNYLYDTRWPIKPALLLMVNLGLLRSTPLGLGHLHECEGKPKVL